MGRMDYVCFNAGCLGAEELGGEDICVASYAVPVDAIDEWANVIWNETFTTFIGTC